ncbi:TetR/AcrR family transcriptional regulator [Paraburkholderia sp. BR14263]|uniref:TetR/AcrR family transcriptional regulator n=1 Tax=unclassified Paraburkholderia TaxID=2615204 RepID=UPI0034CFF03C
MKQVAINLAGRKVEPDEPKRRGNRTTRTPEILEAAIDVLAKYGNVGFALRRVASEVGIHLATLQHYFPSREDLLRAAMEEVATRYLTLYQSLVKDDERSPEVRLDAIVDVAFDELTKPGTHIAPFCLEGWSMGEREEFARALVARFNRQFQETFASLVGNINPSLTPQECALRGRLLYSHMAGLIVLVRPVRGSSADIEALRAATKVVWRALSAAPQ